MPIQSSKTKSLLSLLIVIILIVGLYIILSKKTSPNDPVQEPFPAGMMTLTGETVCLPHRDTSGPTTLECAIGLRTDKGDHFSLDMSAYTGPAGFLDTGKRLAITGDVVPVEALSSIQKYAIRGVIRVQSIEELSSEAVEHTTPGGIISFSVPPAFGFAVHEDQVLVSSYIPPCDSDFLYCIYYNEETYSTTNFDSAGLRIQDRTDLTTQSACLTTLPTGYSSLTPEIHETSSYATSLFEPLGDAGAGHYSQGALYRLFTDNTCYEFETRIGESQFANYPEGEVERFTESDRAEVHRMLRNVLDSITIPSTNTRVVFPTPRQ